MKELKNGLLTGLTLQLAIGPVFFFIINLTLQKSYLSRSSESESYLRIMAQKSYSGLLVPLFWLSLAT